MVAQLHNGVPLFTHCRWEKLNSGLRWQRNHLFVHVVKPELNDHLDGRDSSSSGVGVSFLITIVAKVN